MEDPSAKTNEELTEEISALKRRITELEEAGSTLRRTDDGALRELNERLSLALEVGNAGIWEWHFKRDEVRLDDRFHAMLGYAPGELPNTIQEWLPYHHPEDVPIWMAKAEAYLRGDSPVYESEHRIRTKAGTWNWVFTRGRLVKPTAAGSPEKFIGIAMNVMARKQTEEALKRSEENFRRFLDGSPLGARIVSAAGETIYANRALLDIYGYEGIEELRKAPAKERYTPESYAEFLVRLEKRQRGESAPFEYEISIVRKDGEIRRLQVFRREILWNGEPQFQTLYHDITEVKRAEAERKAHIRFLENLERVDRAIRQETDVEQMLRNILQTAFSIFDCDRAWLVYPCDPDAPSFRVPMEITRPEYPGAMVLNMDVPMSPGEAGTMREALASDDPVTYTAGTERPISTAKQFGVQSQMFMPVHPKLGSPWVFGMHQCSHPRIWTEDEKRLFKEIGRRMSDGLSSALFLCGLQENAERFRATFEQAAVGIAHVAPDGRWLRVNQKLCDIVGYSRAELLQMTFLDITHPDDLAVNLEYDRQVLAGEIPMYGMEKRYIHKEGSIVWINLTVSMVRHASGGPGYFIAVIEDITRRKRAEEELRRVNRALRMLSDTNQALIRITDETALLNEICRIIVEIGGYRLAWVGFAEQDEAKTVRPAAHAGVDSGYIESAQVTWADNERGRGPGGVAIRTGRPCMVRNIPLDPVFAPWREEAVRRGYQSIIALPLIREGRTFAVLGIYAGEVDAFDAKEVEILNELANDLAFGVTALRTRVKQVLAEEQLHLTLDHLRKAVGTTIRILVSAVESRDPYTSGHQNRAAGLARAIATEMGLPQDRIDGIRMAGSIHDIGKLSVPAEILSNPRKLTEVAFSLIKEHSRVGYELLKDVESIWPLAEIVHQHHERMDGTGYPRNLKGDEILPEARVIAVADVVEAMASHRPYRPALGIDAALAEIEQNKGTLYDDAVADACLRLFREKGYKLEGD